MNKICTQCGREILRETYYENGQFLCWECYCRTQQDRQIHKPSYHPEPIFYGSGNRYYIVTVQFTGNINGERACQMMRRINQGRELVYCRHSSLLNNVEFSSYPMSLSFYRRYINWEAVLQEANLLGCHVCRLWVRLKKF